MRSKLLTICLVLICFFVGASLIISSDKDNTSEQPKKVDDQVINKELRTILNQIKHGLNEKEEINQFIDGGIVVEYLGSITLRLSLDSSESKINEIALELEKTVSNSLSQVSDSVTNVGLYDIKILSKDGENLT